MNMSLRLITWEKSAKSPALISSTTTHIFVPKMLEEFQLAVGSFGEDRGGKGLHDLLDRHRLLGELVFGGAVILISIPTVFVLYLFLLASPLTYQTRPNAPMPTGCRSVYLIDGQSRGE
jgi:hypothetical protein